ncbi:MAG: prenyltransferase [Halobacteriota archaeon]
MAGLSRRLLRRSRPRFWLYLAGPTLLGVVYGVDDLGGLLRPEALVLLAYFLVPANVLLYGVNDWFDADIDRFNPKKGTHEAPAGVGTATKAAVVASGFLLAVPLAMVQSDARPWLLGFLVLALAYSVPPVHLKRRPFLDSISNGLYILPGVGAFVALTGEFVPLVVLGGGWAWTMAMHTFSAIPDVPHDRAGGVRTTATVLGPRGALVYCATVWLLAATLMGLHAPTAGAVFAVYPVVVVAIVLLGIDVDRAYWWYPWLNATLGMVLTLAGLWGLTHG